MLQATILATSSGRDWRTWLYTRWPHAGRVYIRCRSNVCRSNVTPRLFIVTDGWMTASETCSDLASDVDKLSPSSSCEQNRIRLAGIQLQAVTLTYLRRWYTFRVCRCSPWGRPSRLQCTSAWVSSAYWWCRTQKEPITDDRGATYKLKHRGPRDEPCGTP